MRLRTLLFIPAAALGLALFAPLARADAGGKDDEKKEKEEAPDTGGNAAEPKKRENPLPKIIELMRKVEERLAEAEDMERAAAQAEQRRIIEALEGQQSTVDQLKKLIEEIEAEASSGGGGGGGEQKKDQKKPQNSDQKSSKERQDQQKQPLDPQGQKKDDQKGDGQKQRDAQNRPEQDPKRREGQAQADDPTGEGRPRGTAADAWGHLPPKSIGAIIDAKSREKPAQYRKQLEEYYRRLMEANK